MNAMKFDADAVTRCILNSDGVRIMTALVFYEIKPGRYEEAFKKAERALYEAKIEYCVQERLNKCRIPQE